MAVVLVLAFGREPGADLVARAVEDVGGAVVWTRPDAVAGDGVGVTFRRGAWSGAFAPGAEIGAVTGVYCPSPMVAGREPGWRQRGFAHVRDGVLASLPVAWANRPERAGLARLVPMQFATAAASGLAVTDACLTGSAVAARRFARGGETVSGGLPEEPERVVVRQGARRALLLHTNANGPGDGDAVCVLRRRVRAAYTATVVGVGGRVFAARPDGAGRLVPVEPPPEVTAGVPEYLRQLGLGLGVFIFHVDREGPGRWWFQECRPDGGWWALQYAEPDAFPVAAALAEFLTGAVS